jgi:hypothetical protein
MNWTGIRIVMGGYKESDCRRAAGYEGTGVAEECWTSEWREYFIL